MNEPRLAVGMFVIVLAALAVGIALSATGGPEDGEDGLFFDVGETVVVDDEPDLDVWRDEEERVSFAIDTATDIIEWRRSVVFDGEQHVRLAIADTGATGGVEMIVETSVDGIEWEERPTIGFEGFDDLRGLVERDGLFATVVMEWDSAVHLATSRDLSTWELQELPVPADLFESVYPIDLALTGERVAVLLGIDQLEQGGLILSGQIDGQMHPTVLEGIGSPSDLVAAGDTFAVAVQVPGDSLPKTVVRTDTGDGAWAEASPLPGEVVGGLHAVGSTLVVTGSGVADAVGVSAVSVDAGRSWQRFEVDPTIGRDVVAGADGLVAAVEGGWIHSPDGRRWLPLSDDRLVLSDGSNVHDRISTVSLGGGDVVMSVAPAFGADGDEGEWSSIAIRLP